MTAFATYSSERAARRAVAALLGNGAAQNVRLLIGCSGSCRATAGSYRGRPPPGVVGLPALTDASRPVATTSARP
jgi:hypothetical protein